MNWIEPPEPKPRDGSRSCWSDIPGDVLLPVSSLAVLEAFPHLTKLTFHRCALPDEILARLLGTSSSLRSRLREFNLDQCCVFHGAVEWGLVMQVPGCSVKWAKREKQRFFDEDRFGKDEDWETDNEGEWLSDAMRRWDFEEREWEREMKRQEQYEDWLEEQEEARMAHEGALLQATVSAAQSSNIGKDRYMRSQLDPAPFSSPYVTPSPPALLRRAPR